MATKEIPSFIFEGDRAQLEKSFVPTSSTSKSRKSDDNATPETGDEEWRLIPKTDRLILSCWHTMVGCMSLLAWNVVLNCVMIFETKLWPGNLLSDILLGCNQAGAVTTVLTLIYLDTMTFNVTLARLVNVLILIALTLLPVPVFLLAGNVNLAAAKGVLCFTVFLLGVGSGIYQAQGFAFAAIIPRRRDQSIFMSTGNGVAGVISWLTFTICFEGVFDRNKVRDMQYLIFVMVIVAILCLAITYGLLEKCIRMPIFKRKLQEARDVKRQEAETFARAVEEGDADGAQQQFNVWGVVRRALYPAFRVGFTLAITILVFPASGPFKWPITQTMANINMGVFQIGDLVFRFLPVLGSWTILSVRVTEMLVFGRVLFLVPFFIIPVYLRDAMFITHPAWLTTCMLVMVLTNGWGMTVAIIHCMGTARSKKEAETTANVMTLFIVLGALTGAFSSKLPLLGYSAAA